MSRFIEIVTGRRYAVLRGVLEVQNETNNTNEITTNDTISNQHTIINNEDINTDLSNNQLQESIEVITSPKDKKEEENGMNKLNSTKSIQEKDEKYGNTISDTERNEINKDMEINNQVEVHHEEEESMTIRILDLNGKFFNISCELDWLVSQLKAKILECADVPISSQRLIYRGRVLEDPHPLSSYKVENGHTIHLFVRVNANPEDEILGNTSDRQVDLNHSPGRVDDGSGMTIVHLAGETTITSAVFPSDSARRVDPLILDSPLGNCARRVKLWSSFLLIIYTMKVMGQFALLANDQQARTQMTHDTNASEDAMEPPVERYNYNYSPYDNQDPLIGILELLVHAFGVYIGCVGFKAAHDTDIRPIRVYCRGLVIVAIATVIEQIYITLQIAQSDFPNEYPEPTMYQEDPMMMDGYDPDFTDQNSAPQMSMQYAYGPHPPLKDDIVSANVFQAVMLVVMWIIAIHHAYLHKAEVMRYNQSFATAAMNAIPVAHVPEVV